MSDSVVYANDMTPLDLSKLTQTFTWVGGFCTAITVQHAALSLAPDPTLKNFVQTITNDGTNPTSVSGFILQP